ncbi:GTP cyclohydrolase FolE2 [Crenobacter luteus]|uniref:GTP cyclohydrolase FolE2 n=2 Tax=Crenobacter luteus TaxID=1452487 RepID=A0A163CMK2_9NEIS|nr:GTP cyclohydrolase FolE2 [Crenobacter luteus]KZE32797.1 GTP cyclohydrolase FolE2 [Crenobacter luteus]
MGVVEWLPDVQSAEADFGFDIDQVGIKSIRFPLTVATADGGTQATVASCDLYVALPSTQKGTHMSRFVELLEAQEAALDAHSLRALLASMVDRLDAEAGEVTLRFPLFVRKTAPVSGVQSLLDVDVTLFGRLSADGFAHRLTVTTPVTSLCPCSKQISQYGAHNQRSHITLSVELDGEMAPEELVRLAEAKASCELFGLLKRPDEKWVTERAYENPKFVEDLVREIALALRDDARVSAFTVESENFESIHNHSAFARIRWQRPAAR